MAKLKDRKTQIYISVIILYVTMVCIANYSLLLHNNVMKWDIFDGHYPYSVFMGDAIKNGQLPLWNPMVQYGTPQYAIAGMPVWYPITLVLSLIGYSPFMMGLEYSLHIVLAGFGMFLLINQHNKEDINSSYYVSIICGCLYMFSTVFVSNAQHIMIFSSATWIPYIMLYLKKYISYKQPKHILFAGSFSALVILGGYPELFAATLMCLIPYTFYETYKENSYLHIKKSLISSIRIYITFFVCTMLGSLITLLPFINSLTHITRGVNSSVEIGKFSIVNFITALLPGVSNIVPLVGDISMIYCYMGIFTLVTVLIMFVTNMRRKEIYLMIAFFVFLMLQGDNSFLYPLFHKFVPLFGSFRFPSVWRCLLVIFILIPSSFIWNNLDDLKISNKILKTIKYSSIILSILSILLIIANYVVLEQYPTKDINYIAMAMGITSVILLSYFIVIYKINHQNISKDTGYLLILTIVIIEILTFQYFEFPVTVAAYPHNKSDTTFIDTINQDYKNRNKSFEFRDALRTNTPVNYYTRNIILEKNLDEKGYMSFRMADTVNYQNSINRYITTQNPKVYFSNNLIDSKENNLEEWLQNPFSPPAQIHTLGQVVIDEKEKIKEVGSLENILVQELQHEEKGNNIYSIADVPWFNNRYTVRKLRVYIEKVSESIMLQTSFVLETGDTLLKTEGLYEPNRETSYIDIYFPLGYDNAPYDNVSNITVQSSAALEIEKVEYIEGHRITKDENVAIESYKLNSITASVNAVTDGYLVVQQVYYPGWKVYVNGEKTKIEKVNGVFMGAYISKGENTVEFKFLPTDFLIGTSITIFYFLIVGMITIFGGNPFLVKNNKVNK
ncbi:MAG TPA: YfhO family protein [Epulopiscium sp.]|nr:YfhO family protein [Candidatus Epulonipiscium sp.]